MSSKTPAEPDRRRTLPESESLALLADHGMVTNPFVIVRSPDEAAGVAASMQRPMVAKLCGDDIAHKTERGLVRLSLHTDAELADAIGQLLDARRPGEEAAGVLVAPMVSGLRELICGAVFDPVFGPMVALGVGGVLTEAVDDVVMAPAPITEADAHRLIGRLRTQGLLGEVRGERAVDRDVLAQQLVALSRAIDRNPDVLSIDVNPMIVSDGIPTAVDALVELGDRGAAASAAERLAPRLFEALFHPRGIIVAGVSSHPGKFGFVTLHNLLVGGYEGKVFPLKLDAEPVLGMQTLASIDDVPAGEADLMVICTPPATVPELVEAAAAKGVTAIFMATAGYGEASADGAARQTELVDQCRRLGVLLVGPNGQGVVSPHSKVCAQIVGPSPLPGPLSVVSQSGNLVSSFENLSVRAGIGISRAVSAGNAAMTTPIDLLESFVDDPLSAVAIVYLEGVTNGRDTFERLRRSAERMPVVVIKGGATEDGARAAASHTGSMATDDRVMDGVLHQAGATRCGSIESAFDTAAAFATMPLPAGGSVAVLTTVGGWGVMASDAISRSRHLRLAPMTPTLRQAIDDRVPPRWSRQNPIDLAGGETRDTVAEVLEAICLEDEVDAVLFLGIGIQSNEAAVMRAGRFFPDHGLGRIVAYHERQDARYAEVAVACMERFAKPILIATELSISHPDNPGPATLRRLGKYCFPTAERAVGALDNMVARATFLTGSAAAPTLNN